MARIVAVGGSGVPDRLAQLVDDGHEVHSIDRARPSTRWLASHADVDLADVSALTQAVVRIGAIVDEVRLYLAVDADTRAAIVAAVAPLGMNKTSVEVVAHYG